MSSGTWWERFRAIDVRILAAIVATILLVGGVMWVVPTTPNSSSFTFDAARRGISSAVPIELGKRVDGSIVDGSDEDFYEISPLKTAYRLDVQMTTGSKQMIPGLRIFDVARNLVQDRSAEYLRQPGVSINTSFLAESNKIYYVQVFTQRNTTGQYSLLVAVRQP